MAPDTTMKGLGLATATLRIAVITVAIMMDADETMPILLCPTRNRTPHRMTETEKLPNRVKMDRPQPMDGLERPTFTHRKRLVSNELNWGGKLSIA